MNRYAIFVHGINFLMPDNAEGVFERLGFYVTAQVEAVSSEEAEKQTIQLVRTSDSLLDVRNMSGDSPSFIIEEIRELSEWIDDKRPLSGFVFYDDPDCEWRISIQAQQDAAANP